MKNNKDDLDMYVPRYSTRDHWTQESIKQINMFFWKVYNKVELLAKKVSIQSFSF